MASAVTIRLLMGRIGSISNAAFNSLVLASTRRWARTA